MKFKLILLFFCVALAGYAQRIEVTAGPVLDPKQIRSEAGISTISLVSPFKSFSYSSALFFNPLKKRTYSGFGVKDKVFQFAILEDYLTYTGIKKLTSEAINDKVMLNAFVLLNDKLYVLYSQKFTERDEFSVYVNQVSEDMVVLGSPIVIQTFKGLKQYGMNVYVSASQEKEYILISRVQDTKPKEKQKIECKVVDPSFSEVWYKLIETENIGKELELQTISLDRTGNLFMLVETKIGKVNQPIVYTYVWNNKSLKTFNVGMATGENFGTRLKLLNGEKPYVVGLNKNEKSVSYFMSRINPPDTNIRNARVKPNACRFL